MSTYDGSPVTFLGRDLVRPECVLEAAGSIYASDGRGGVTEILPDRTQRTYLGRSNELARTLTPNGIHLEFNGDFLVAHLAEDEGGVFRLARDGTLTPFLREVDGTVLPPTNYVNRDWKGRVWITVSTHKVPRSLDYNAEAASGFIVLVDEMGARIAADGLGYTNECSVSPDGRWLYANETFAKRLSRFPLLQDGSLGRRETVCSFGIGEFPDGLAFARDGSVWVSCIFANRIIRVDADGSGICWLDAGDAAFAADIDAAMTSGTLTIAHMSASTRSTLGNASSIAFGGEDGRTAFIGSLQGERIATFRAPAPGYRRCSAFG